jgi:hypothetical protein
VTAAPLAAACVTNASTSPAGLPRAAPRLTLACRSRPLLCGGSALASAAARARRGARRAAGRPSAQRAAVLVGTQREEASPCEAVRPAASGSAGRLAGGMAHAARHNPGGLAPLSAAHQPRFSKKPPLAMLLVCRPPLRRWQLRYWRNLAACVAAARALLDVHAF